MFLVRYNMFIKHMGGEAMAKTKAKKKRRKTKLTARPDRAERILDTILAGTISGLIVAAILELLGW